MSFFAKPLGSLSFVSSTSFEQQSLVSAVEKEDAALEEDVEWPSTSSMRAARASWERSSSVASDITGHVMTASRISKAISLDSLHDAVSASELAHVATRICRRDLMRGVVRDEEEFRTCVVVPLMIVYALLCIIFFQLRCSTPSVYLAQTAIQTGVFPDGVEIHTPADITRWMRGTFMPFAFENGGRLFGDSTGASPRMTIVAGLLLQTARGQTEPCDEETSSLPCYLVQPQIASPDLEDAGWASEGGVHHRRLSLFKGAISASPWRPASMQHPGREEPGRRSTRRQRRA
mmetsp:Transcript_90470/g.260798  ORF Transcript_90470/g.260798 Transcript_90470/m.260798 type:complete len:290 (-) Transcript_90470:18-887(-)